MMLDEETARLMKAAGAVPAVAHGHLCGEEEGPEGNDETSTEYANSVVQSAAGPCDLPSRFMHRLGQGTDAFGGQRSPTHNGLL